MGYHARTRMLMFRPHVEFEGLVPGQFHASQFSYDVEWNRSRYRLYTFRSNAQMQSHRQSLSPYAVDISKIRIKVL